MSESRAFQHQLEEHREARAAWRETDVFFKNGFWWFHTEYGPIGPFSSLGQARLNWDRARRGEQVWTEE